MADVKATLEWMREQRFNRLLAARKSTPAAPLGQASALEDALVNRPPNVELPLQPAGAEKMQIDAAEDAYRNAPSGPDPLEAQMGRDPMQIPGDPMDPRQGAMMEDIGQGAEAKKWFDRQVMEKGGAALKASFAGMNPTYGLHEAMKATDAPGAEQIRATEKQLLSDVMKSLEPGRVLDVASLQDMGRRGGAALDRLHGEKSPDPMTWRDTLMEQLPGLAIGPEMLLGKKAPLALRALDRVPRAVKGAAGIAGRGLLETGEAMTRGPMPKLNALLDYARTKTGKLSGKDVDLRELLKGALREKEVAAFKGARAEEALGRKIGPNVRAEKAKPLPGRVSRGTEPPVPESPARR